MPSSLTTVEALLKEVYAIRLEDQLQDETVTIKRIERTNEGVVETVGGKYVDFPVRVKRNSGIGWRSEGEQLPAAGNQGYAEVHVPLKYGYGRVRFTGQLMELAEKNYQAFASGMDNEIDYLKSDVVKDSNFIAHADGTGLRATLTDTATSTSHTVDNPQWLEIGMHVDLLTITTGVAITGGTDLEITDIVGSTITFSGSTTGATTVGIYRTGDYGREPTGLGRIIDDTTELHGLDPATQRKWAAYINDNSGTNRPLSEGLMIATCDQVRRNGGKISAIFTSLGVRRAYFNLLVQQRRYTDTKEFAGGFQGLPFNYGTEIPVVEDVDAPPNLMRFVEEDKIRVFRNREWHWMEKEGNMLKWVQDYDAYQAVLRQYSEFGTTQRNAHAELQDITEG